MAQLLLLLDRLRPALDFLAVAPEQVGQRLQQMARGELAERRQRQATLSPQSLDLGLQLHRQTLGIPVPLDPALHAFGQLELQLPVVQRVQFERLFVVAGQLLVVETHLEPLLEERIHRVGEELRQRSQPQRALQLQRRQWRFSVGNGNVVLAMDLAPLAGVGEQAIDALLRRIVKIPAAERLQRMLLGQGTQQRLAVAVRIQAPAGRQVIAQLADQHRGRPLAIVADTPPHPAHVELLARREQRLEQQVAVVLAPRAVAGAVVVAHQVEIQRRLLAGVVAIVHAKQADQPERDRAHRHQRAETHRASQEALVQAALVQAAEPGLAYHADRQRLGEGRTGAVFLPALEQLQELGEEQFIALVVGLEEHREQGLQALAPLRRGGRFGQLRVGHLEALQQHSQRACQGGVQATDLIVGLDALQGRAFADRVAEQHAPQTEAPTVALQSRWQAETLALRGIQPPAHAGAFDPAVQGRQVGLVDAETPAQCRDVQQVEDLAHGETAVGQFQQVLQGDQQRLATALSLVGQGIGNEALVVARHLAEHRLDVRRVGVDVGDHDDHVARLQARIGVEAGEQLVVEDLHFALRAVGHMEADRGVAPRRHRRPVLAGFRQRAQFEDIVLQLAEQPVRGLLAEQVDAPAVDLAEQVPIAVRVVVAVEQVDVVAALLAPGRQQRLGMLVLAVLVEVGGDAGAALLATVLVAQQVLVGDDVGPVVATGVVHAEQHLAEPGQGGQCLEGLRRHRGNPEHHHSSRQRARRRAGGAQRLDEAPVHAGAAAGQAIGTDVGEQRAPQFGLPALVGTERARLPVRRAQLVAALAPVVEPVAAIDLVLVEQVGQALGQLMTLAQVGIVGEETLQGAELGTLQQSGKQTHQAPGQRRLVQFGNLGNAFAAQHRAIGLPEELRRQLHLQRRGDAATAAAVLAGIFGQCQLQPLGDAVAVHQDPLAFQRRQRIAAHPGNGEVAQVVQAIAVDDHESGREGGGSQGFWHRYGYSWRKALAKEVRVGRRRSVVPVRGCRPCGNRSSARSGRDGCPPGNPGHWRNGG